MTLNATSGYSTQFEQFVQFAQASGTSEKTIARLGANTDLSDKDIAVVSIYGDVDGVLDMEEYEASKSNLPADMTEHVIKGGNHSQFGSYGLQEGDNKASITPEDIQAGIDLAAETVADVVDKSETVYAEMFVVEEKSRLKAEE